MAMVLQFAVRAKISAQRLNCFLSSDDKKDDVLYIYIYNVLGSKRKRRFSSRRYNNKGRIFRMGNTRTSKPSRRIQDGNRANIFREEIKRESKE